MKQEEDFLQEYAYTRIHTHTCTYILHTNMHSILLKTKYIASKFKLTTRLAKCSSKGETQRVQNYFRVETHIRSFFLVLCNSAVQKGRQARF